MLDGQRLFTLPIIVEKGVKYTRKSCDSLGILFRKELGGLNDGSVAFVAIGFWVFSFFFFSLSLTYAGVDHTILSVRKVLTLRFDIKCPLSDSRTSYGTITYCSASFLFFFSPLIQSTKYKS